MITVTIEVPDNVLTEVVNYLRMRGVIIKDEIKDINSLIKSDYEQNFAERAKKMRHIACKHLS